MSEIKVHVVRYPGRKNLVMRYKCPETGKQIARSTGTHQHSKAVKVAAKWEAELQEGRYQRSSKLRWEEFRDRFEDAVFPQLKPKTIENYIATLNAFEKHCRPQRVSDLTTQRITAFTAELRKPRERKRKRVTIETKPDGKRKKTVEWIAEPFTLSEASVARHLRHLKAVARWAHGQEYLPKPPKIAMPGKGSGAQRMKGRPITTEEFERMLAKTGEVVGTEAAESWKLLLRGLWATGLRLGEAMALRWDHQPGGCSVTLEGQHSILVFDGGSQKSGKCQTVPLAPEAVELLEPRKRSAGYVFNPRRQDGEPMARHVLKISKTISAIGKAAGVVTDPDKGKWASAHDLRRAFGSRWSKLLMPATLKEIMRHASIETTMTYYVSQDARMTAAELWAARVGNTQGNIQAAEGVRS